MHWHQAIIVIWNKMKRANFKILWKVESILLTVYLDNIYLCLYLLQKKEF
jgi:hypothetical protein